MYKIKRFFKGVFEQAKKVRWPTKKQLLSNFVVVLIVVAIAALALSFDDFIIAQLLGELENQFGTPETTETAVAVLSSIIR